jgi:hypothetical protein
MQVAGLRGDGMDNDGLDEIGFDIGWDFARFGRILDEHGSQRASVIRGYRAGRHHFRVPQHCADRYVAKWLQLRLSALRRNRLVAKDVTPSYLRSIDAAICPVTLDTLTHSALVGTDWSVDRINNDGAYATGNLIVISAKANMSKGRKSYFQVAELGRSVDNLVTQGLRGREWARLACLMHGADETALRNVPCGALLTRIPVGCRVPLFYLLQQILIETARPASLRNSVLKTLGQIRVDQSHHQKLRMTVERLAMLQKNNSYPYDALADDMVQTHFGQWYRAAYAAHTTHMLEIVGRLGAQECAHGLPAEWAIGSKGYLQTQAT